MTKTDYLAVTLLIIGGLVLGLDGLLKEDVLQTALSAAPAVSNGLKMMIGLAAVYAAVCLVLRHAGKRNQ
ncbi:DUF378 domain-containing protein [Caballeronia sp. AZ10_KS36]|uniref:DUF378 domain-containing protein n=1 Tax=Caballeronia sp. AZ10_KS36 TaxID=2921757 RepID=UPI002027A5A6|nr:DUF378 domain-containing protein [Caballeronia sp. AZ10_KS36]